MPPPRISKISRLCLAVAIALSSSYSTYVVAYDGEITDQFFFLNKGHYDEDAHYLLNPANNRINGSIGTDTSHTAIYNRYSKLNAYLESEDITIYDPESVVTIQSNVSYDAYVNFIGTGKGKLKILSDGADSGHQRYGDNMAFSAVYLSGTEDHFAKLQFTDIDAEITMENVVGNKDGDFKLGGAVIGSVLSVDYKEIGRIDDENVRIEFHNSNVTLNLDIEKYTHSKANRNPVDGVASGILLSGNIEYNEGKSRVLLQNSTLTINSSLHGIFLHNSNIESTGTSDLTINAGSEYKDLKLYSSDFHLGSGIYAGASKYRANSIPKPMNLYFEANSANITGINGIELAHYDAYQNTGSNYFKNAAPIELRLNNLTTKVVARDTNGYFNESYALTAKVEEDVGSKIELGGDVTFENKQTGISNDTGRVVDVYGIDLLNFKLDSIDNTKKPTSVKVEVSSKLNTAANVFGLFAESSSITLNHPLTVIAEGQSNGVTTGIALNNSDFTSTSDINIVASNKDSNGLGTAFDIKDGSEVSITGRGNSEKSQIVGQINVEDGTFILNRNDPFEIFGAITAGDTSKTDITLSNKESAFYVSGNSAIDVLNLTGGLLSLDLSHRTKAVDPTAYHELQVEKLTLSDATLQMKVDVGADKSDIIHTNEVKGTATVYINPVGSLAEHKDMTNGFLYQETGDLTLQLADKDEDGKPDQVVYQNGSLLGYKLAYKADGMTTKIGETSSVNDVEPAFADEQVNGTGKGYWYLVRGDQAELPEEPTDPDNPDNPGGDTPLPPEAAQIMSIGTSAAQAVSWMAEREDLRHRLGEIRYGAESGAWVKVFNQQQRVHDGNGFKQETSGVHLGADTIVSRNESGQWLVGAALRYADAEQDGLLEGNGASGDLKEYSTKLYATYVSQLGSYVDFVGQIGYYDQKISGIANDYLSSMRAEYNTYGIGLSAEIGHHFKFDAGGDRSWFIEPSVELSYFFVNGKDYTTSTNIKVEQNNAEFLSTRAGLAAGHTFNYGLHKQNYVQFGWDVGVYYEFLGDQTVHFTDAANYSINANATDIGGWGAYYGANMNWKVSDNTRVYGEVSRKEGNNFTEDYSISVGLKYAF